MTGLNVEENVIIELAAIITDSKMQPLANYHSVIYQPQSELDKMDDWNKQHHGQSGLVAQIPNGKKITLVEEEVLQLVQKCCTKADGKLDRPMLAGNSIWQDRVFITKYMPKLTASLHYRMLDVSSWKIIFKEQFGIEYVKKNTHRALDDIQESIAELAFYSSKIKT